MKLVVRIVLGVLILGGGLGLTMMMLTFKSSPPVSSRPQPVKLVRTFNAEVGDVSPSTYIQGRTVAKNKIEVYSEVGGNLLNQSKEFRAGVKFNKGETLLRIDGGELRLSLVAQRSAFLQLLTSNLADFKIDFPDRYDVWKNYTAALAVDERLATLPEPASDQEKFFISNKGILNQYYTIRSSEERLDKYTVRAPFNGEVSQALVNTGALVRVGQKMGEFVSSNQFEVESALSAEALGMVQVGDSVKFTTMGTDEVWKGTVERIAESIDPTTQSAKVYCSVIGNGLRDGMYLNGIISSSAINEALRIDLDLLSESNSLFVVRDSLLKEVNVEVLYKSEKDAIVRGIQPGTKVLRERINNAFDGMQVNVSDQ